MGGEPAGGYRGKGMADGVEQAHAGDPVGEDAGQCEDDIDEKQRLGGFGDPRRELGVLHRAGGLGPVELHAADAQHGHDRHGDDHDADAAQPVQLLPVVEQRLGQKIEPGDDGAAGGGQPGDGFEGGTGGVEPQWLGQHQRDGTHQAQDQPEQHGDHKAVAGTHIRRGTAVGQPDQHAQGEGDRKGEKECLLGVLAVVAGHRDRDEQGDAEQHQHQTQYPGDGGKMHGTVARRRSGRPGTAFPRRGCNACRG